MRYACKTLTTNCSILSLLFPVRRSDLYLVFVFIKVRVFANQFMKENPEADLAAIRIASVNPILDPWIYILLRRSLFRRLLSLSRRGSSTRSSSPVSTQRSLFYPEIMKDSHVFTQLMRNTNILTQLPDTVKFTRQDAESLHQS